MLTISLDEAGVFDAGQTPGLHDSKTTLIGGVLFDDLDSEGETDAEKERIKAFYIAAVEEANKREKSLGATYPSSLHSGGSSDNNTVKCVKKIIDAALPEFFKTGTFKGNDLKDGSGNVIQDRKGIYRICAVVKSSQGKTNLKSSGLNDFVRDDKASNTYFHMASEVTSRLIFHNPFYSTIGSLSLQVATRRSADISDEYVQEYRNAGYNNPKENGNMKEAFNTIKIPGYDYFEKKYHYAVMNEDIFRTLIAEQMMVVNPNKVSISECRVVPINYNSKKGKGDEYEFLYLADSLCGYLTFRIEADDVNEVFIRADKLSNAGNLIFSYDSADILFDRAIAAYEDGYYYEALSSLYDLSVREDNISELYNKRWSPYLIKMISDNSERFQTERALDFLHDSIMTSNFDQMRAKYIFEALKSACDRLDNDRLKYYYNDIGVSLYCHMGDTKSVRPYFVNCEKLAGCISFEEYARTRNRFATSLCDTFDNLGALRVVNLTVDALKEFSETSKRVFKDAKTPFGIEELAKATSLKGQALAFMKDESAETSFDDSLSSLQENSPNYRITESYLLHHYVNLGQKDKYLKELRTYCGDNEKNTEQLNHIFVNSSGRDAEYSLKYAIYLYLKGAYRFFENNDLGSTYEIITKKIKKLTASEKKGHPWELIYKYLVLMGIKLGVDSNKNSAYEKLMITCCDSTETLIDYIIRKSQIEILDAKGMNDQADTKARDLARTLNEFYEDFYDGQLPDDPTETRRIINNKLTYMYE